MIGGGRGAFIGAVHRIAAALDGQIELVCGAFSADPEKSKLSGQDLLIPPDRCYGDYQEMILTERALPVAERIGIDDLITLNHLHISPAKLALEDGFHVLSDKPATFNLTEARELKTLVTKTGRLFALRLRSTLARLKARSTRSPTIPLSGSMTTRHIWVIRASITSRSFANSTTAFSTCT